MTNNGKLKVGGPTDPLKQGPEAERELFTRLFQQCGGFPFEVVAGAAGNLLINVLRQQCATSARAGVEFDELFGKLKTILMQHYDGAGKRRSIFPHDQTIEVPYINLKKR
jgi:hypothetical protein